MKADRVVLDTNVLISAAIMQLGKAKSALRGVIDHANLVASQDIFDELDTRLQRWKFDRYVTDDDRYRFKELILRYAEIVALNGTLRVCRDPDDDKIIETAVAGCADALVSGDKDLLALRPIGDESEIEQDGRTIRHHDDVGRFDIAMHDAEGVS